MTKHFKITNLAKINENVFRIVRKLCPQTLVEDIPDE